MDRKDQNAGETTHLLSDQKDSKPEASSDGGERAHRSDPVPPWQITDVITGGTSSHSVVYVAVHDKTFVAIKRFTSAAKPEIINREIAACTWLAKDARNLVGFLCLVKDNGGPVLAGTHWKPSASAGAVHNAGIAIVWQYCPNDLHKFIKERIRLDSRVYLNADEARNTALQLLSGLVQLHDHSNLLHRDINLSTIRYVVDSNNQVTFKIGDYSEGRYTSIDTPDPTGTIKPSEFISPTAFNGRFTVKSDIFGLGIVLFYLLTLPSGDERPRITTTTAAIMERGRIIRVLESALAAVEGPRVRAPEVKLDNKHPAGAPGGLDQQVDEDKEQREPEALTRYTPTLLKLVLSMLEAPSAPRVDSAEACLEILSRGPAVTHLATLDHQRIPRQSVRETVQNLQEKRVRPWRTTSICLGLLWLLGLAYMEYRGFFFDEKLGCLLLFMFMELVSLVGFGVLNRELETLRFPDPDPAPQEQQEQLDQKQQEPAAVDPPADPVAVNGQAPAQQAAPEAGQHWCLRGLSRMWIMLHTEGIVYIVFLLALWLGNIAQLAQFTHWTYFVMELLQVLEIPLQGAFILRIIAGEEHRFRHGSVFWMLVPLCCAINLGWMIPDLDGSMYFRAEAVGLAHNARVVFVIAGIFRVYSAVYLVHLAQGAHFTDNAKLEYHYSHEDRRPDVRFRVPAEKNRKLWDLDVVTQAVIGSALGWGCITVMSLYVADGSANSWVLNGLFMGAVLIAILSLWQLGIREYHYDREVMGRDGLLLPLCLVIAVLAHILDLAVSVGREDLGNSLVNGLNDVESIFLFVVLTGYMSGKEIHLRGPLAPAGAMYLIWYNLSLMAYSFNFNNHYDALEDLAQSTFFLTLLRTGGSLVRLLATVYFINCFLSGWENARGTKPRPIRRRAVLPGSRSLPVNRGGVKPMDTVSG